VKLWQVMTASFLALAVLVAGNQVGDTNTNVNSTREMDTRTLTVASASSGTIFPIIDPKFVYASSRHLGETRVGSVGDVNSQAGVSTAIHQQDCSGSGDTTQCTLRFEYTFNHSDPGEFAGVFFSFGRISVDSIRQDGTQDPNDIDLSMDSTFDLTDLMQNATDDGISIESLRLDLRRDSGDPSLSLKIELKDQNGQVMSRQLSPLSVGTNNFDLPLASGWSGSIDLTAVKVLTIVILETSNPQAGGFHIEFLGLEDKNGPGLEAADIFNILEDNLFVAAIARRDFESMLRLADAKTGASLDRTLSRDLIHWGATGWLLASLPAAVNQGWITSSDAQQRGLKILQFVDNDSLWGDGSTCKLGSSLGLMYRLGGIDSDGLVGPCTGTRKLNVGNINAVEASTIDTALFQFGAATFAAGFPSHSDIQTHVSNILNRTRWDELVEPGRTGTGQFYLAWKPEKDTEPDNGGCFTAPATSPLAGFWASREEPSGVCPDPGEPLTIDIWTDEGALVAVLAAGADPDNGHPTDPTPWYSMLRDTGTDQCANVVVTFPGSWFTYAFLAATYMDQSRGQDRGTEWSRTSVNWPQNTVDIFNAFKQLSPSGELVLPDAVEYPDTTYHAQGLPKCAGDAEASFTGTRTPYSLQLAVGLGGQSATDAIDELRKILDPDPEQGAEVWDPMFGFLDSFHADLAGFPDGPLELRNEGRWVQQQVFPLNKGGALLAQLNFLDNGVIRNTANQHAVINRGIDRIYESGCAPYGSKDWVVPQSCPFEEITSCATVPENVIVLENVAVTIAQNACLDIDFSNHHLRIKNGAKVVIKNGGRIK